MEHNSNIYLHSPAKYLKTETISIKGARRQSRQLLRAACRRRNQPARQPLMHRRRSVRGLEWSGINALPHSTSLSIYDCIIMDVLYLCTYCVQIVGFESSRVK